MITKSKYTVRKHAGRSGKSVFGWRVYVEWQSHPPHGTKRRKQLSKHRTEAGATKAAEWRRQQAEN